VNLWEVREVPTQRVDSKARSIHLHAESFLEWFEGVAKDAHCLQRYGTTRLWFIYQTQNFQQQHTVQHATRITSSQQRVARTFQLICTNHRLTPKRDGGGCCRSCRSSRSGHVTGPDRTGPDPLCCCSLSTSTQTIHNFLFSKYSILSNAHPTQLPKKAMCGSSVDTPRFS
jgi:hypothetical protein